jgi:hypothetical protein
MNAVLVAILVAWAALSCAWGEWRVRRALSALDRGAS